MHAEQEFQRRLALIERAIRELEATPDAGLRATMQQLVQSIMELHGGSLDRLMTIVRDSSGVAGQAIVDRLGADPLVGHLLILYGLHPRDVASRVADALADAGAALASTGVSVALDSLDAETGTLRVRLHGVRRGDGATPQQIRDTIEDAMRSHAPEVVSIHYDDHTIDAPPPAAPLVLMDHRGRPLHRSREPRPVVADADEGGEYEALMEGRAE